MNSNSINQALSISDLIPTSIDNIVTSAFNDSAKSDFEQARANLLQIIDDGKAAIAELAGLSSSSQDAKTYQAMAQMMKTIIDANKDLLTLQKNIRELEQADQPRNEKAKTITNNLFVGSTADLMKALNKVKNSGEETD